MNLASFRKHILPHIIIVLVFIAFSFMFLSPMLKGKVLPQNDIKQWAGSYQETKDFLEKTGERTLWTNSMFGGMPTYHIAPYSPNSLKIVGYVYGVLIGGIIFPRPMDAIFAYCLGMYLLLLAFRVNPWVAMAGGLAFGVTAFNAQIIEAGHMLQAYAVGTGPMVLAAAVFTLRWRKYLLGTALFTLALAIHVRTNHPQVNYYTGLVLAIYLVIEAINYIKEKRIAGLLKAGVGFAIGVVLVVGSTATFMLTTAEYTQETIRGKSDLTQHEDIKSTGLDKDYAFGWSYGVGETFNLLIPDFRGGASGQIGQDNRDAVKDIDPQLRDVVSQFDQYWGSMPFVSGPTYMGAVVIFLFVLGLIFLKGNDRWWILGATVFSILLSWGRNFPEFNDMIFHYFPLYNKFRSVNFTLIMAGMVVPLLAVVALDRVTKGFEWGPKVRKNFFIAFGLTGGLCLLFWLMPGLAGDFLKPENQDSQMLKQSGFPDAQINMVLDGVAEARANILKADAIRSFLFIALSAAAIFMFFIKKIKREVALAIVCVLMVVDLYTVSKRYLNDKNFVSKRGSASEFIATDADNFILQDKDPNYRVLNVTVNTFNDATTSYFHKSVGGYHGAKLRRFQELREKQLDRQVGLIQANASKVPGPQLLEYMQNQRQLNVLNMLNTKYIIAGPGREQVIKNPYALGNAWFVKGIRVVPNADAEIAAVDGFSPADSVIVDARYNDYLAGFAPAPDASSNIKLVGYKPNHLTYTSNAGSEQFAVFSEIYYNNEKGWDAYIDGKLQKHIRVDWLLRGMRIPAGQHKIEFRFQPKTFAKGETISLISSLIMLAFILGAIAYEVIQSRRRKQNEQAQTA